MILKLKRTNFIKTKALLVVSKKLSIGKEDFKCFIDYKDVKENRLYAYSIQKCIYIEEILMKLNICIF